MSIDLGNNKKWKVDNTEIGFYIIPPWGSSSANPLKLHIPKIMPLIPRGKPKVTVSSLNKSCYLNEKSCAPSVPTTVRTQNYISVKQRDNRHFIKPLLRSGSKVYVDIENGNIDTMYISTKVDNSFTLN